MPILKRKVIRQSDGIVIEERNETTPQTKTVSVIPSTNYLICDKCGKNLTVKKDHPVTIECSQCGCPTFHTSLNFTAQCMNCGKIQEADKRFYGYCKCNNKIWNIL
jgi:hypothetical protein